MPTPLELELGRRLTDDEQLLLWNISLLSSEQKEVFMAKLDAADKKTVHKYEEE